MKRLLLSIILFLATWGQLIAQNNSYIVHTRLVYNPKFEFLTIRDEGEAVSYNIRPQLFNVGSRLGLGVVNLQSKGETNYYLSLETGANYGQSKNTITIGESEGLQMELPLNYAYISIPFGVFSAISLNGSPLHITQYAGISYHQRSTTLQINTDLITNSSDSLQVFYTDYTSKESALGFEAGIGIQYQLGSNDRHQMKASLEGVLIGLMCNYHTLFQPWQETEITYKEGNKTFQIAQVLNQASSLSFNFYVMIPISLY